MTAVELLDSVDERDWPPPQDGTVRYALIGLGWWTVDKAIPAIAAADYCETAAVVSGSTDKAHRVADNHNIPHALTYEEFHDGDVQESYDAVYIATPNVLHREYAETAAELGKAVLCEKPIEATADRAEAMVAACRAAGVPFMGAYRMQTDPIVRRAREVIDAGGIGRPVYAYGTNSQPLLEMIPDPDQWRLNGELSGYGSSVMDLGIYSINTTRFLLDRDPVQAWAGMATEHDAFADVDDQWATFSLAFPDDIYLMSTTSQHAQRESRLTITGTEGALTLAPAFHGQADLRLQRGDRTLQLRNDGMNATTEMTEEFDFFAARVLRGDPIPADGRHSLVDMATIHAIHRAAEIGEPVPIEQP